MIGEYRKKRLKKPWIALVVTTFLMTYGLQAAAEAGGSTAIRYQSNPDLYIGKRVDLEISQVRIVPAIEGIDGLTFIIAKTYDFENHCDGGEMLVIVQSEDAERLRRKYGTTLDKNGKGEPETKRMRGTLRMVGDNMLFLEYSEDVLEIVQAHYDSVKAEQKS